MESTEIKSASTLFSAYKIQKGDTNLRRVILKEIYQYYASPTQEKVRKIENWKRYRKWCMSNRVPNTPENQKKFKKSKDFLKVMPEKSFAIRLSHVKTAELWELKSMAADRDHRGHSVGGWLFAKPNNDTTYNPQR